jgi:protein-S-isoprenylcysteine O-methyltransferase Ste14
MWILLRAVIYATLFIGTLFVFLPSQVLSWSGVTSVPETGVRQILGMILTAAGASLALWCILTFVWVGKGTPAPFDPPRRLVVGGPYGIVRNPMYVGAGLVLTGAALFYESTGLVVYAVLFALVIHAFVVLYEEPTLRRMFGGEYESYRGRVGRWWPKRSR